MTVLAAVTIAVLLPAGSPESPPDVYWIDRSSRLMWTAKDNGHGVDWDHAKAFCAGLRTAEFQDWRLPDIKELEGLYDPSSEKEYKISAPLQLTGCCPWSSTTEQFQGREWVKFFSFQHGAQGTQPRGTFGSGSYRALCVRLFEGNSDDDR